MAADRTVELRSGLPRHSGGEPWPPGGRLGGEPSRESVAAEDVAPTSVADQAENRSVEAPVIVTDAHRPVMRQGLPRVSGGEAWPPVDHGQVALAAPELNVQLQAPEQIEVVAELGTAQSGAIEPEPTPIADAPTAATQASDIPLRRGLPRVSGGEPWPAEGFAPVQTAAVVSLQQQSVSAPSLPTSEPTVPRSKPLEPAPQRAVEPAAAVAQPIEAPQDARSTGVAAASQSAASPAPPPRAQTAPAAATQPVREPRMIGSRSLSQWVKLAILGIVGAIVAAAVIVLAARGVTTLPGVPEFMERYPGEYHPVLETDEGFPAWARWTHFLNFFFMVLIVRTGLLIRYQQKPPAFYTPKKGGKKVSLYLWLHTSIDLLWLINGVVFVVLLFVTNHWVRIVPTSWEVFPNALSAGLQYLTLEWPTENGWVNYNSLQQLMYFTVVFIAAPLAAITGVRMSEWWPEKAKRLNRLYPAPLARAIHFPVMLFFVFFVIVHVFLVMTTGALRNLNHMFAGTDQVNWVGFWWFAGAVFLSAVVTWLARPLVLAPIANLFGRVSNR